MCPACITTVLLAVAGAGSTGGLTAFVARTLLRKRAAGRVAPESNPESRDGSSAVAQQVHSLQFHYKGEGK